MFKISFQAAVSAGIFLLGINVFGQQADRPVGEPPLPPALASSPLTGEYLPGARPFGGMEALDARYVVAFKPFQAELNAREVETKPDGTIVTHEYHGTVARDKIGRVFREQLASQPVPGEGGGAFNEHAVVLLDPLKGLEMKWNDASKIVYQTKPRLFYTLPPPLDRCATDRSGGPGAIPDSETQRSENLGERMIQGILTRGCRVYTLIPADAARNQSAVTEIDESWSSPELRIVLLRIHHQPDAEDEVIRLDKIVRGEPEAALFQMPADYRVIDPKGEEEKGRQGEGEKGRQGDLASPIAVEHREGLLVMKIDYARPLQVAIDFLRLKYGWRIDYEEPPLISELVGGSEPKWRAAHPDAPPLMIPAGGKFETGFSEEPARRETAGGEKQILEKIVADYNRSGNPGKYAVREVAADYFAVVGISAKDKDGAEQAVTPIFDTLISLPAGERSADATINLIFEELGRRAGTKVADFSMVNNRLLQKKSVTGAEISPARKLLQAAISGGPEKGWNLLYDANQGGLFGFSSGGYSIRSAPE